MTFSRQTHAADELAPDDANAPFRTENAHLPAIDAGPILMRAPEGRRAIPGFDGEDGEPFDVADLVRQVEDASEAAARAWPGIRPTPQRDANGPARADELQRELGKRRAEIAELQEVRQQQAKALRRARDEMVGLDDTVKLLNAKLTRRDKETTEAKRALQRADDERAALRAELEQTNANFVELLQQTAELNDSFDQREKEFNAVQRTVDSLKAQLKARAGGTDLKAAIEDAKARYYKDFNRRFAQFEGEVEKLARMIGARDERIRSLEDENTALNARCEALAAKAAALETAKRDIEAAKRDIDEKLEAKAATVTFLDQTLQTERDDAGQKIARLTAGLRRERLARAADAREAASVCREMVQLLPRLARPSGEVMDSIERAGEPNEPEMDSAANDPIAPPARTASS